MCFFNVSSTSAFGDELRLANQTCMFRKNRTTQYNDHCITCLPRSIHVRYSLDLTLVEHVVVRHWVVPKVGLAVLTSDRLCPPLCHSRCRWLECCLHCGMVARHARSAASSLTTRLGKANTSTARRGQRDGAIRCRRFLRFRSAIPRRAF